MKRKTIKFSLITFSFVFFATLSFLILKNGNESQAASTANFNAGNIISDYMMGNYTSMTEAEIQSFLKSKVSCDKTIPSSYKNEGNGVYSTTFSSGGKTYYYHGKNGKFVCLADEKFGDGINYGENVKNGETAAHIIWQAAQDYKINPQALIVLLEKEQSLITDKWPNNYQYRSATGYGCPDTAACDSKYYGFKNQVRSAANLFRTVLNGGWTNYPLGKNYIKYNPDASCGGSTVDIKNLATSALYRYTPYQPNAAALAAGYGTAACGAYGNRNFYLFFYDWFGDPTIDKSTIASSPVSATETKAEPQGKTTTSSEKKELYIPMDVPRYLRVNTGKKVINSKGETVATFAQGMDIKFMSKIMVNNKLCLRALSAEEVNEDRCVLYADLTEKLYSPMDIPRFLHVNAGKKVINSKGETVATFAQGMDIKFMSKIMVNDKLCLRALSAEDTNEDRCILYTDLTEK